MCRQGPSTQRWKDRSYVVWYCCQSPQASINAGVETVQPVSVVHNLGVWIETELSMCDHISRTCQACFFHLCCLRSICKHLERDITIQLVLSLLDYCNSFFAGLPAATLAPLQQVLPAATQFVYNLKPFDHVTSALKKSSLVADQAAR